jgi:hypothetical protein
VGYKIGLHGVLSQRMELVMILSRDLETSHVKGRNRNTDKEGEIFL